MTKEHKRMLAYIDREIEVEAEKAAAASAISSIVVPVILLVCWMIAGY